MGRRGQGWGQGQKFRILLQTTSETGASPNSNHSMVFILCCVNGDLPGLEFHLEGGRALLSSLQAAQGLSDQS